MNSTVSIIVAHDDQLGIGKNNQLLFRISKDLKHFKKLTTGHPIIMGRKTFESIGKPLPNRTNIIVTRNQQYSVPDRNVFVVYSLKEALDLAKQKDDQNIFIIGGGQIYQQALDQNLVDKLYVTKVKGDYQAEVFFPDYSQFKTIVSRKKDQEGNYQFTYLTLTK
ncbi:dihydrofolate reductase [Patescibacteria group bacterium]